MTAGRSMVNAFVTVLRLLVAFNDRVLRIGKTIAWISLVLMVVVILTQIVFRYVLNNALPWPDEAARFLMLWMTGLIAPLGDGVGVGHPTVEMIHQRLAQHRLEAVDPSHALVVIRLLIVRARLGDHVG